MSEVVSDKIENYRTAPIDARFPKNNQTRNCSQKYLVEDHCAAMGIIIHAADQTNPEEKPLKDKMQELFFSKLPQVQQSPDSQRPGCFSMPNKLGF